MKATDIRSIPMIIGGTRCTASDGAFLDAVNPANGGVVARFPDATEEDVSRAVAASTAAFEKWRRSEPADRGRALLRLAEVLEDHASELAELDVLDNGSPIREMRNDVGLACAQLRYFAGMVLLNGGNTVPTSYERVNYSLRQPYGVVARIVPFNHPLMFAASKIAAPLAAGNTVIVKPSEHTSLSALRLAELADDVFPPGVLQVVTGTGRGAGDALVRHPAIRRLAFTGSADTGRAILRRGNEERVKVVTLELGGKNPLVIFPDADIDQAIDAAQRGMNFTWQGQSCGSTSRLLVHSSIHDDVVERLAAKLQAMRLGDPTDEATDTGAIVNNLQYDKVLSYIGLGRAEGARLLAGGYADETIHEDGLFIRPTLFTNVAPDSRLAQEEIFGPVLAVTAFEDYDQALRIANSVRYGLTASVFTHDLSIAHRFARDVEAGYVWVNEVSRHIGGTAFGGVKDSGIGREEDLEEMFSYGEVKNVHINFG